MIFGFWHKECFEVRLDYFQIRGNTFFKEVTYTSRFRAIKIVENVGFISRNTPFGQPQYGSCKNLTHAERNERFSHHATSGSLKKCHTDWTPKKATYFLDIFSLYSNPHEHIGSEALGAEDRSYRGCCLDIQISTRECPDIDDKDVYQSKMT
jgi:hypothetical protein